MKIIDAVLLHNEIDVLKMRFELHYDYVDYFCVCESDHTFSGKPKDYNFEKNCHQFKRWEDKIRYIPHKANIEGLDFSKKDTQLNFASPAWKLEFDQRNDLVNECKKNSDDDDIILICDVDEFLDPNILTTLREPVSFDVARLEMINHYYFMNCRGNGENKLWYAPVAIKPNVSVDFSTLRSGGNIGNFIRNAGWHFSYLGGVDRIREKISSFSHTELDNPQINNEENIRRSIQNGEDYISRFGHEYAFYPISSYPDCIQKLMLKNSKFVRWRLY